jgi:lipoprotein-releasing system permease protein
LNLALDIAKRYLFGKKSTNAINVISGISIFGMTIGTAALILILSVFNGFEVLIGDLFNSFNPDYKINPAKGVYFEADTSDVLRLKNIKGVDQISLVLEEVVLFDYGGIQEAGFLKGVDENFNKVTSIDSTMISGNFVLKQGDINFAVCGYGISSKLSVNNNDLIKPINVYAAIKSNSPLEKDYAMASLYPSGVFSIDSEEDGQYIFTNIEVVRSLIKKPTAYNAVELKKNADGDEQTIREEIEKILGKGITIKNKYQQNESFLKIMNIEKWIAYLIACFTIALISFNLVGALWMIVLDKKRDISVLKSMGYSSSDVKKIIIYLGAFIGGIGLFLGILIALLLYFLQKNYDLISVPEGFLIDAYPIELKLSDFLLVSITVIGLAVLGSLIPAKRASRISTHVRQE